MEQSKPQIYQRGDQTRELEFELAFVWDVYTTNAIPHRDSNSLWRVMASRMTIQVWGSRSLAVDLHSVRHFCEVPFSCFFARVRKLDTTLVPLLLWADVSRVIPVTAYFLPQSTYVCSTLPHRYRPCKITEKTFTKMCDRVQGTMKPESELLTGNLCQLCKTGKSQLWKADKTVV